MAISAAYNAGLKTSSDTMAQSISKVGFSSHPTISHDMNSLAKAQPKAACCQTNQSNDYEAQVETERPAQNLER
jgi:hypothetical protein